MTLKLVRLLSDLDVAGKRVFVRADLDVPLTNSNGQAPNSKSAPVEQATRLKNLKPTVDYLLKQAASQIIIAGHLDRPTPSLRNGKPVIDPVFSTKQLLASLERILGQKIVFLAGLPDNQDIGASGIQEKKESDNLTTRIPDNQQIVLLENLRFWPGETENDPEFARQLATLTDVYVNEAFGNCHRNHASMVALPQLLPDVEDLFEPEGSLEPERPDGIHSRRAAGLHLEQEVKKLSQLLNNPQRPLVAIVGGTKIETKLPLIEHLAKTADYVLVGGELVKGLTTNQQPGGNKILGATLTPEGKDIEEKSIEKFRQIVAKAKTVVWNGPLGVFEEGFTRGTLAIAQMIVASGAHSVVGGGETTQFLTLHNLLSKFSFVSSGGGAMLEFLAGKRLPALQALD